tara:strand:+ start:8 stop:781 length:774 start_codon:yes stop_codon:yes gene_type:complete
MVVADASGTLSTWGIPSGADGYIGSSQTHTAGGKLDMGNNALFNTSRIAIGSTSSTSSWELYCTGEGYFSSYLRVNDYLAASGGVHVGGTTDPGTDNLVVDGQAAIGGAIDNNYQLRVYGNLRTNGIDELSDERWKKDVVGIENALEKVLNMNGVYYNWKKDEFPENEFTDRHQVGFIAQELEKILPEVVNTDDKGYKSVMYGHVVALLVEAIKDLEAQVDKKTTSLEEKTKEIDDIKASLEEIQNILGLKKESANE